MSLRKGSYKVGSRYNRLHISEAIIDVILHLEGIGLIGIHKGTESAKRSTRIWPTRELVTLFKGSNLNLLTINPHKDKEVIVLNDAGSKAIEYKDED